VFHLLFFSLSFPQTGECNRWRYFLLRKNVRAIAFEKNYVWAGSEDSGLAKIDRVSEKITFYNSSNSGLPTNTISTIAVDERGNKWIGTCGRGVVKFDDSTWVVYDTSNSGLPSDYITTIVLEGENKWIGTMNGGVVKFNGFEWIVYNTANSGLPDNTILCIFIDKMGNKWFGTQRGFAKFSDSGWVVFNRSNSMLPSDTVTAIAQDPEGNLWLGTAEGVAKFSLKNGSWDVYKYVGGAIKHELLYITSIAIDSLGSKWIGTVGFLYSLIKFNSVTDFVVYPSTVIIDEWDAWGTPRDITITDEEFMMLLCSRDCTPGLVNFILIDKMGNKWIGARFGLGVHNENGVVLKVYEKYPDIVPDKFKMYQNYPNPFNSTTIIEFDLTRPATVDLIIYDLAGREIKKLLDKEYLDAGRFRVRFDAFNLPSGVYIYHLRAGEMSDAKKMILIK